MKAATAINWLTALGFAVALLAPGAEEPTPVAALPVGPELEQMVALCREVFGPESTVYMRTAEQAACDTRVQKVAAP